MVNDVLSLLIIDTQKLSLTLYSNSIDDNYLIMIFNIVNTLFVKFYIRMYSNARELERYYSTGS